MEEKDGSLPIQVSTNKQETLIGRNGSKIYLGREIGRDGEPTGRLELIAGTPHGMAVLVETDTTTLAVWARLATEGHEALPEYMKSAKPNYSIEQHRPGWPGECPDCGHETDGPYPWWDGEGRCPKCGGDWRLRQDMGPQVPPPTDDHVVFVQGDRGNALTDPTDAPTVVHFVTGTIPKGYSVLFVCLRNRPCPMTKGWPPPKGRLPLTEGLTLLLEDGAWTPVYWPMLRTDRLKYTVEMASQGHPSELELGLVLGKDHHVGKPSS